MAAEGVTAGLDAIREAAHVFTGAASDLHPLMEMVGEAAYVLIGEASHGTHEFYATRAELTRRLIEEKGFCAVAIEGDWPDAYRVDRFVQGFGSDASAEEALSGFGRFPEWMWRNSDVLAFVDWLRKYNDGLPPSKAKVGFYGLDLYSLHASMQAVLRYLGEVDPKAAERARGRYACFEHFGEDPQAYGYAASLGVSETCEHEVLEQLRELHKCAQEYARRDGWEGHEEFFSAEQNARLVKSAEEYYRSMFNGDVRSWNLRDGHMADTFQRLVGHLERTGRSGKIVVWAHNSHLGDARATSMGRAGEWNVGQLLRQRFDGQCRLIGFSTYDGTVMATSDWDGEPERKQVRPARSDSYEGALHATGLAAFSLVLERDTEVARALRGPMLERAIGVIYRPETEFRSHYFQARLSEQFDAVIHLDRTSAVEPLPASAPTMETEPAETYPTGM